MSWSIKLTGLKAAVVKEIVESAHLPNALKKTVIEIAECSNLNGLSVDTFGHVGGASSSVGKFEVMPVHLVMDSPPKPEPVPARVPVAPAPAPVVTAPVADVQVAAESSAPAEAAAAADVAT